MGLALVVACGGALAACSSSSVYSTDPNLFPTDYKKQILLTLTQTLTDPTNVKEAGITDPALRTAGKEQRYAVCVRLNARDGNRRYTGVKERIAYFYAGSLNQMVDADQGQCANASYQPWPELEKYCLAKSCT
jgi:hypothetical protein